MVHSYVNTFTSYVCKCQTGKVITVTSHNHTLTLYECVKQSTHTDIHVLLVYTNISTHNQTNWEACFFLSLLITQPLELISRHPITLYLKYTHVNICLWTHKDPLRATVTDSIACRAAPHYIPKPNHPFLIKLMFTWNMGKQ